MKSILYVGATLMIGASIYGFVDYKRTSRNKQFTRMYESTLTKETTMPEESITTEKKEEKVTANPVVVKKKSPSSPALASAARTAADKSKKMRSKKLDHRLFSRAPLREYQEEAKLPAPAVDSLAKDVKLKAEL